MENSDMKDIDRNLKTHLIRLESKLVRGFEELGINIDKDPDWMSVDDDAGVVYVTTLGRSLMVTRHVRLVVASSES